MLYFLFISLLAPLCSSIIIGIGSIFPRRLNEKAVARITTLFFTIYLLASFSSVVTWLINGAQPFEYHLRFFYCYFDKVSAVFLSLSAIISNVIAFFSHRYLHRDLGFRRFFVIIAFFTFGITLVSVSGSLVTLFFGWEIVGLSSFLLIAFYWHRPRAVINAMRTYCIYHICDVGLLCAVIMPQPIHPSQQWIFCTLIIIAVLGKSAQFPFSFWLPRAMEGPTPSSAIFYGALSIHAGVFLLLRTYPIWHETLYFPVIVGTIGLITTITCTFFGNVQTNIKGQIGYASVTQVGIMLIELALGFPTIALIHLAGNACLRCFQLLVSPSVVTELLRIQAFAGKPNHPKKTIHSTLYVFALNEGFLDNILYAIFIRPFQTLCSYCNRAYWSKLFQIGIFIFIVWFPNLIFLAALFYSLSAMGEKNHPKHVLNSVLLSNLLIAFTLELTVFYFTGLMISWIVAIFMLSHVAKHRLIHPLNYFSGLLSQFPRAGHLFLLGNLGLIGFPFTQAFFGVDHLAEHAMQHSLVSLAALCLIWAINGITLIFLFSKIFLGKKEAEIEELDLDISALVTGICITIFVAGNWLQLAF